MKKKILFGLLFCIFNLLQVSFAVCYNCSISMHGGCIGNKQYLSNGSTHTIYCCCGQTSHLIGSASHSYNKSSATCITAKKCTKCGYVAQSALGHTGGTATCTTKKKCTRCGARYGNVLGHTGGTETCTKGKICTRNGCGVEYTNPLGHITPSAFSYDDDTHWKICQRSGCNEYLYKVEQHYGGTATLNSKKKCTVCGAEYGKFLADKFTSDKEEANSPELIDGMIPVKWNGSNWITTDINDEEWYNYNSNELKWANVMLADGMTYYVSGNSGSFVTAEEHAVSNGKIVKDVGSMFVWIPRYTYKLSGDDISDISWSKGVKDRDGFLRVPAFFYGEYISGDVNDDNSYINRDGVRNELTGIWVAKFLASENNGNIEFKPNKNASINKTISEAYVLGKDVMYVNFDKYGIKENVESHMMKNSEWQALAYLTLANLTTPYNNSNNKITGFSGLTQDASSSLETFSYDTIEGRKGSTTHNIYGLFDMSGIEQFVSGYLCNGDIQNGKALSYIEEGIDVDKYVEAFSDFSLGKENDEVIELSENNAFISRGGNYTAGNKSGMYGYKAIDGKSGYGYRSVILPINLLDNNENIGVLEAKDSVAEGDEEVIELLFNILKPGKLGMEPNEFIDQLEIVFEQSSLDKNVYTNKLNAEILSINEETNISSETALSKGMNSIKIKIGGRVNNYPVFRVVENSIGKLLISDSFRLIDSDNKEMEVENVRLGTVEIDVISIPKELVPIKNIKVEKYPYKMVGNTDLVGGVIKIERENESIEYVNMTSSDVEKNIEGNTVTLTYEEMTVSFELYSPNVKTYLEIDKANGTGTYNIGEKVDLYFHSANGSKFLNWQTPSENFSTEHISYVVPENDVKIVANIANVSKIEVSSLPLKTSYKLGESIDLRGGRLKVTFNNDSIDYVDMICENVYVSSGDNFTISGENSISVFYGDKMTEFMVNVY